MWGERKELSNVQNTGKTALGRNLPSSWLTFAILLTEIFFFICLSVFEQGDSGIIVPQWSQLRLLLSLVDFGSGASDRSVVFNIPNAATL